jgi:hypothetical protein
MSEDKDARIYACKRCGKLRSKNEGGTVFTVCDECWAATSPPPVAATKITFEAKYRDDGMMFVTSPDIQFFSAVASHGDWATVFEIARETAKVNAAARAAARDKEARHG